MAETIIVEPPVKPVLDPGFVPAVLWNREFLKKAKSTGKARQIIISLERNNGTVSTFKSEIFPDEADYRELNLKYVERLVKNLLWTKGGYRISIAGAPEVAAEIKKIYSAQGARSFDNDIIGKKIYGKELEVVACELSEAPESHELDQPLGRNLEGYRIGFDLGGSDRKCAAMVDGKVIFSEEVEWDPYFWNDPQKHKDGINDSLKRAAAKMPRVDAIGGSSAGVYVDNKVRVASLFRGVSEEDFQNKVVNMFNELQEEWKVPFIVVNDGEVTALAGSMSMNDNAVLGLAMGTSQAVGYVNSDGNITDWLNELAFAPVDFRENGPADEWSGDLGCGVQYFSQQAVARLAPLAGIMLPDDMPFPERLIEVQKLMEDNDAKARRIYESIGVYLGYSVAYYSDFYDIKNLLLLGRVTSGEGGNIILATAEKVLAEVFPELAEKVKFRTPDEKDKRHGQAIAAASLPSLN
jgi:predicted NBD/HSP70 family sugar kinase